jgi:hypothetical protein
MVNAVTVLAALGLVVCKLVDIARNAFDKHDAVPKVYWQLLSHGVGVGIAVAIAHLPIVAKALPGIANSTPDQILYGLGFGPIASFWHELQSSLSGAPASTPKGLTPSSASAPGA